MISEIDDDWLHRKEDDCVCEVDLECLQVSLGEYDNSAALRKAK